MWTVWSEASPCPPDALLLRRDPEGSLFVKRAIEHLCCHERAGREEAWEESMAVEDRDESLRWFQDSDVLMRAGMELLCVCERKTRGSMSGNAWLGMLGQVLCVRA